jgi:hypothetical protein
VTGTPKRTSAAHKAAQKRAKALARAKYLPERGRKLPSRLPSKSEVLRRNVVGIGLGRKLVDGKPTKRMSVRIYVQQKLHEDLLPKKLRIPPKIGGVPTDVIQVGRFKANSGERNRELKRPFSMGASVGHDHPMAGTAGAILRIRGGEDPRRFLLSNNHVLARENLLPVGAPIFQPGQKDWAGTDSSHSEPVARLTDFIRLKSSEPNSVDCAIAELTSPDGAHSELIDVGPGNHKPIVAREQMRVLKTGRTTGVTHGQIVDVALDIEIDYPRLGSIIFHDQILIKSNDSTPFSLGGDSGALVVTDDADHSPLGLLFASSQGWTVASQLQEVHALLEVDGSPLELTEELGPVIKASRRRSAPSRLRAVKKSRPSAVRAGRARRAKARQRVRSHE